jgi:hypothetical protein
MEESESAEVITNLLIPPCRRDHGIEDVVEIVTRCLHNYIAFVAVEIKFVASLVCCMFVLIRDYT